jgi:hypothetical protein
VVPASTEEVDRGSPLAHENLALLLSLFTVEGEERALATCTLLYARLWNIRGQFHDGQRNLQKPAEHQATCSFHRVVCRRRYDPRRGRRGGTGIGTPLRYPPGTRGPPGASTSDKRRSRRVGLGKAVRRSNLGHCTHKQGVRITRVDLQRGIAIATLDRVPISLCGADGNTANPASR